MVALGMEVVMEAMEEVVPTTVPLVMMKAGIMVRAGWR